MSTQNSFDLDQLPADIKAHVVQQDYSRYTPIEHACWRYILRVNTSFFSQHAHPLYSSGLEKTGIPIDRIPNIQEMDECLKKFGWRAVPISGFIPPAVFLELQSFGILGIACEMRSLEHIAYTPAPDIVHEAAGHAALVVDPDYSHFLKLYGAAAKHAIFSKHDMDIYDAIRELSDLKESAQSTQQEIQKAEEKLQELSAQQNYTSEANQITRMAWWTNEYGLIGSPSRFLIFGAGLLSSAGESFNCLQSHVRKIPFSLDTINTGYDITKPQPQLFVTPSFQKLCEALEEYSKTMAYRQGGSAGLAKALMAETLTTTVLDSGLQISGTLTDSLFDLHGEVKFLRWKGPVQLSLHHQEIPLQGPAHHPEGFSTPLGLAKQNGKPLSQWSLQDWENLGFVNGKIGRLEFESGFLLEGQLLHLIGDNTKVIARFRQCNIRHQDQIYYQASWGDFDLVLGQKVTSVFGGAADRGKYFLHQSPNFQPKVVPTKRFSDKEKSLHDLYQQVRDFREKQMKDPNQLQALLEQGQKISPQDWLLPLEIYEISLKINADEVQKQSLDSLLILKKNPDVTELIQRGLHLLTSP